MQRKCLTWRMKEINRIIDDHIDDDTNFDFIAKVMKDINNEDIEKWICYDPDCPCSVLPRSAET